MGCCLWCCCCSAVCGVGTAVGVWWLRPQQIMMRGEMECCAWFVVVVVAAAAVIDMLIAGRCLWCRCCSAVCGAGAAVGVVWWLRPQQIYEESEVLWFVRALCLFAVGVFSKNGHLWRESTLSCVLIPTHVGRTRSSYGNKLIQNPNHAKP